MEQGSSSGPGQLGRDGEDPVAESFRFPPPGVVVGEADELGPGGQLGGEADQGAPDPVLGEVVQRQIGQAGVLGVADPVLGAGPAAVGAILGAAVPLAGGIEEVWQYVVLGAAALALSARRPAIAVLAAAALAGLVALAAGAPLPQD